MKKVFLTLSILGALATTAVAQNGGRAATASQPELTAEQKADKETAKAATALSLSDAQKTTFKKLSIERFNANKPLREKAKASTDKNEKQKIREQVKANNEKFFTSVNSMLTPEQQVKWADRKKKMQEKGRDAHQE